MGKNRNYTNYSKSNKPAEPAATETPDVQTPKSDDNIQKIQETPVATETTTNTIPEPQTAQPEPDDQTPANTEQEPDLPKAVFGTVVNCAKLNIRVEADKSAEIVCVIDAGTEVEIIEEESTDDFYAVSFDKDDNLIEGYCMKQYIEIK